MSDSERTEEQVEILAHGVDGSMTQEGLLERFGHARIVVFGVGGAGCNAVNQMIEDRIEGITFVAMNTDAQALAACRAPVKILLGGTGLGAGGDPVRGRSAAEETIDIISEKAQGADMVFVAAGMGGGTGTGAAPVVARVAREAGALTVAVVTKPFAFEGPERTERAARGLTELRSAVDSFIVVSNDKLMLTHGNMPSREAFRESDRILSRSISTIVELINRSGLINLDFADIKTTLTGAGLAVIGFGDAKGPNRAEEAARAAISSPLLEASVRGATRILVNITASPDCSLSEIEKAVQTITEVSKTPRNVLFGEFIDQNLQDQMSVSAICTCFADDAQSERAVKNAMGEQVEEEPAPTDADVLPQFLTELLSGNGLSSLNFDSLRVKPADSAKLQELTQRVNQLTEENSRLSKIAQSADATARKLESTESLLSETQSRLLEAIKDKATAERSAEQARASASELMVKQSADRKENQELSEQLAKAQTESDKLRERIASMEQEKALEEGGDDTLKGRISALERELDLTRERNSQLESRVRELEDANAELEARVSESESEADQDSAESADMEARLQEVTQQRDDQVKRAESYQMRLRLALEESDALSAREKESRRKMQELAARVDELQDKLDHLGDEPAPVDTSEEDGQIQSLQSELELLRQQALREAAQYRSDQETLISELDQAEEENSELTARVTSLQSLLDEATSGRDSAVSEIESLRTQVEELKETNAQLSSRVADLEMRAVDLDGAIEEESVPAESFADASADTSVVETGVEETPVEDVSLEVPREESMEGTSVEETSEEVTVEDVSVEGPVEEEVSTYPEECDDSCEEEAAGEEASPDSSEFTGEEGQLEPEEPDSSEPSLDAYVSEAPSEETEAFSDVAVEDASEVEEDSSAVNPEVEASDDSPVEPLDSGDSDSFPAETEGAETPSESAEDSGDVEASGSYSEESGSDDDDSLSDELAQSILNMLGGDN